MMVSRVLTRTSQKPEKGSNVTLCVVLLFHTRTLRAAAWSLHLKPSGPGSTGPADGHPEILNNNCVLKVLAGGFVLNGLCAGV